MSGGTEREDPAVSRLREYLRIKTVHPNPDYGECIITLRNTFIVRRWPLNIIQY